MLEYIDNIKFRKMRKARAALEVQKRKLETDLREAQERAEGLQERNNVLERDLKMEKKARRSAIQVKKDMESKFAAAEEALTQLRVLQDENARRNNDCKEKSGIDKNHKKAGRQEEIRFQEKLAEEKSEWKRELDMVFAQVEEV